MMKKIFLGLGMAMCLLFMVACHDNDSVIVSKEIQAAFDSRHPNAKYVRWEMDDIYYEADFKEDNLHKNAWFTANALWLMSEADYRFNQLPQAVQDAFNACEYANWQVDDVDVVFRPNIETIYIIEVVQGENEVDLHFDENGNLIKIDFDLDDDSTLIVDLPDLITNYIATTYPNAIIVDAEYDYNGFEVDILYQQIQKELYFSTAGNWTSTVTEIAINQIPQIVLTAIQESQYANYQIDEVDFVETPNGNYYIVELELNNQEVTLEVPA